MWEFIVFTAVCGVSFMAVIYIVLCTAYIMDFCVRLLTNDKYAIISKAGK